MGKGKLLMLLSRDILLADGGREKLLCDAIRRFSAYFEVHCLYFRNKRSLTTQAEEKRIASLGVSSYQPVALPSLPEMAWNFFSARGTIQESIFFSRKSMAVLGTHLRDGGFDAVYFDMVRLYRYAECLAGSGPAIIFDLDDLLSRRYAAMANEQMASVDVSGSYQNFSLAGKISKWPVFRAMMSLVFAYESRKCLQRESEIGKFSAVVLLTSPEERRVYLDRHEKGPPVFSNFPIVRLAHADIHQVQASRQLIWLGNNNVPHNRMALKMLVDKVLPGLGGYRLLVIGNTPCDFLKKYESRREITFFGFVEDVGQYMVPGRIMVAPFLFGSGIKIKILEAMAAGVAVVTNEIGFQGIPSEGNDMFRPVASPAEMQSTVLRLHDDSEYLSGWIAEQDETLQRHFSESSEGLIAGVIMPNVHVE